MSSDDWDNEFIAAFMMTWLIITALLKPLASMSVQPGNRSWPAANCGFQVLPIFLQVTIKGTKQ